MTSPRLKEFRKFEQYRGNLQGLKLTRQEMNQHFVNFPAYRPYVVPANSNEFSHVTTPTFQGYSELELEVHKPRTETEEDELAKEKFEKRTFGGLWRCDKVYGDGVSGLTGRFIYAGPPNPGMPKRVVVKMQKPNAVYLTKEANFMRILRHVPTTHIVKDYGTIPGELHNGFKYSQKKERKRTGIIMEYCSEGSLGALQKRRYRHRKNPKPFLETSLWRIFDCFVDLCSVLELGVETIHDPINEYELPEAKPDWVEILHMDLKPDNVFLGPRDSQHSWTPVLKLGDFGLSVNIPHTDFLKRSYRRRGTPLYLTPEQLSEAWDYPNWTDSDVAGEYSSSTNIWGIGAIMFELLMFQDPPQMVEAFYPDWEINGARARGRTFSKRMRGNNGYSETLRNLIYECLYEVPHHRPRIRELKKQVALGLLAAEEAAGVGNEGEPWEDFAMSGPAGPDDPYQPHQSDSSDQSNQSDLSDQSD